MSNAREIAQKINDLCVRLGWSYYCRGGILTIEKRFTPGDMDEFVKADCEYFSILRLMPAPRPGSIWGTDGGGVGAVSAHKNGHFVMNKSGCNKNVLKALEKL